MKAHTTALWALTVSFTGCAGPARPPAILRGDSGLIAFDLALDDALVDVTPREAEEVARDVEVPDAAPPVDLGSPLRAIEPGLCVWRFEELSAFAVRFALCTFRSPQAVLDELFRPDAWEGGALASRSCGALRCFAEQRSGSCLAWLAGCLKLVVTREQGGVCVDRAAACEGAPLRETARSCAEGVVTRDECSSVGLRCVASGVEGACVAREGTPCVAGAPARCVDNVVERCVLGTYTPVRDCRLTGSVCDADAGTCAGDGAACVDGPPTCDGTALRACRGGRWHALDCGRLVRDSVCQTVGGHAFCGLDRACDPTTAPPRGTCDGDTMVLCSAGRVFRYLCAPLNGFTRCEGGVGCVL